MRTSATIESQQFRWVFIGSKRPFGIYNQFTDRLDERKNLLRAPRTKYCSVRRGDPFVTSYSYREHREAVREEEGKVEAEEQHHQLEIGTISMTRS